MTEERTQLGRDIEESLKEVLAHVRGEITLPSYTLEDIESVQRLRALRKRLKLSRQKFADRFGLNVRAVQDWEQGRRMPDRAARVLLKVIEHNPKAVEAALADAA
ncbi:MAG: helix-turn-helix domain-containing protein [Rhodospirillales bacterium]